MSDSLQMTVSPIVRKNGKKLAYVSFMDQNRTAEGRIPDCVIFKNDGFSAKETAQLEEYMKRELNTLKKMAAQNNLTKAFMGK